LIVGNYYVLTLLVFIAATACALVLTRHLRPEPTAVQSYLTSSPVTDLPMIMRWISLVPSKMVKILAVRAVYAGQRPAGSVVSARIQHAPSEMNVGLGSARVDYRSWYERTPRRPTSRTITLLPHTPPQVHRRYIFALTCKYPAVGPAIRADSGADGPHAGLMPGMRCLSIEVLVSADDCPHRLRGYPCQRRRSRPIRVGSFVVLNLL
jgi:hypothetical protein